MPPDAAELQHDSWWHWYILLGIDAARGQGVLVYGTGSDAEHQLSPPLCLDVQPPPAGPVGTGVRKWTHFTPPAIVRVPAAQLFKQRGALPAHWHNYLAAKVREGAGIERGLGIDQQAGKQACRGRVARLADESKQRYGSRFALVLTAHEYSCAGRYQVIVPIYDARRQSVAPQAHWVRLDAPWAPKVTNRRESTAFYAEPELVTSLWAPRHIEEVYPSSVTDTQMRAVDDAVFQYLVLTRAPAVRPIGSSATAPTAPSPATPSQAP